MHLYLEWSTSQFYVFFSLIPHVLDQDHLASHPNNAIHALVLQAPVLEASQAILHKTEPRLVQESLVRVAGLPSGSVGIPEKEE